MELPGWAERPLLEERAGLTMSGYSAKRRKTTAMAPAGVLGFDSLPPELLEGIFSFLDAGTLCTARLVCAQFRDTASRFLHSVELPVETLRSRPGATLNNFPNLSRVGVFDVCEDDLLMLAQSPVGDAITHLRAVGFLRPVPRRWRSAANPNPLLPLPNLRSLAVTYSHHRAFPFPQTLRELSLTAHVTFQTANLVTRLTNLTSLRIDVHHMRKPFLAVTALTALQRLEICSGLSLIPFVAQLTLLTHLQLSIQHSAFQQEGSFVSSPTHLLSLARLNRLAHLGLQHLGANLEHQVLASVAAFTSLRSLDLELYSSDQRGRSAFETVCMTPFSQLTALRLESFGLDASFLPRFSLEALQYLSLSPRMELDRDGVAALRRATGLTYLHLCTTAVDARVGIEELGMALSRMSRLRALSLDIPGTFSLKAVALLTELTRLEVRGWAFAADVEVCLGLKKMRLLRLEVFSPPSAFNCIMPETLFAIAKLPELRQFCIWGTAGISGGDLTNIRAWLNAHRHHRGWPPLELGVHFVPPEAVNPLSTT